MSGCKTVNVSSRAVKSIPPWAATLLKCTDRRIERAQAADYEENIANIQPLGGD